MRLLLLLGFLAVTWPGRAEEKPTTAVKEFDEVAMAKAIERARKEVGAFIMVLQTGNAESFNVKVKIEDEYGTEHLWLSDVRYKDGVFTGVIGNEPVSLKKVKMGQEWSVKEEEISDWTYQRGDRVFGAYTIDPMLPKMPKERAEEFRRQAVR